MYFRRYIDSYLKEWKESARRKPLLLRGARQVGKSRSIRHLGESFAYFAEVNFETRPELRQIFKGNRFTIGHIVEHSHRRRQDIVVFGRNTGLPRSIA